MYKNIDETRIPIRYAQWRVKNLTENNRGFFFEITAVCHIKFDSRYSLCIRKYVTDAAITFSLIFLFL